MNKQDSVEILYNSKSATNLVQNCSKRLSSSNFLDQVPFFYNIIVLY